MSDAITIEPAVTALLVMDYQPFVLGRVADADALVAAAARALDVARAAGMHVGYVRVAFEPKDVAAIPSTQVLFGRYAPMLPADAPHTQVDPRLAPRAGDIVVRKTRVGAFSTTDLDAQLRARGVTTLVLAGISTGGVVLSTAREAFDRDYRVAVLSDACADHDPEVHAMLLTKVLAQQVAVMDVAGLERAVG